jgi:RsbT co-antagonist protein rsbRD N-terminal domain
MAAAGTGVSRLSRERHTADMKIEKLLSEQKSAIIKKWFDAVVKTYPEDSSGFLGKQKDPFTNPVGHTIRHGIEGIFDELLGDLDYERVSPFLDEIIRVRAVQDFTPSQAVSFIFSLKRVIRDELLKRREGIPWDELPALESRIDRLALFSFDIFVACREKLYEIKANELRNMTFRLLQRVNVMDEESGSSSVNNDNV